MSPLLRRAAALRDALERVAELEPHIRAAADAIAATYRAGGTVLVAGNGGSAAEAQHLTGELVGRLSAARERRSLPAIALAADVATLTAVANDYGFDHVFRRGVEAFGRSGDALVLLSTSGRSANCVLAAETARARGLTVVALVGAAPGPLHHLADHVLACPGDDVATIQETHLLLVHALTEQVEDALGLHPADS